MSTFSENLRRIRFEKHMTQEEFAELLGTSKQNVSRYESGAVSPKISTAKSIADKLGIPLAELAGELDILRAEFLEAEEKQLNRLLNNAGQQLPAPSRSPEWRVLSEGLGNLEKKNKAAFQATYNYLTAMYPDIFTERTDDDDSES